MDILTHTVSGLAVGALVAGFSKREFGLRCSGSCLGSGSGVRNFWSPVAAVAVSGLGGALPDIDAASWLLGDGTYSGQLWYSHHGFFHSLSAAGLFAFLIWSVVWLFDRRKQRSRGLRGFVRSFGTHGRLLAGFVAGFALHLLEDMPTPASTWGGVRMFFPAKAYIGGTGQIWWWNNYDIFIVACAVFALCCILLFIRRGASGRWSRLISLGIFVLGCVICTIQIYTRNVDYAYTGHTEKFATFEEASKAEQRRILGPRLFNAMERLDRALPVQF